MIMLGGKAQGSDADQSYARKQTASIGAPGNQTNQSNGRGYPYPPPSPSSDLPFDDDIPF